MAGPKFALVTLKSVETEGVFDPRGLDIDEPEPITLTSYVPYITFRSVEPVRATCR